MSLRGTLPYVALSLGLIISLAYHYRDEISYFASYYSSSPKDRPFYDDLDRIERAIALVSSLVKRLESVPPSKLLAKAKEVEVDADFILESLDGIEGNEFVRARRKRLVEKTLAITARIEKLIRENLLSEG